ncbi:MerR family transcriptional regulator [Dactylosporangium sp. NBC_01737]|uniref:MerR family transcriptional regulator n=1 Tax=Dactylosporangium sp. NBC_01737 TaxID=2975959 RepID=UPI002E0DC41A|nr:MerR family transcriptional regulator [Dactylosporangium sp. NBC_01737]
MDEDLVTIGVFARRSWLSPKALRLYERQGLLLPAAVDEHNGYRWYREEQLETARLIARLRRLDMPLTAVAAIVAAEDPQTRADLIGDYWSTQEHATAVRRELVTHLRRRLLDDPEGFTMYDVKVRDVPEQTVLTEQRHVKVQELSPWIDEATGRLLKSAAGHGDGIVGPCFIIYHGEVNEDSDGPVEICLPVDPTGPVDAAVRVEPAHREAYTRIIKAQVGYPQILSAFDAVAQWVSSQGLPVSSSPREVYFADFGAAAPSDEVCDVAFPLD